MVRSISLTILFLLAGIGFFAQSGIVKGTVTDELTGETIIGATISYSGGNGTITDIYGNYTLTLPKGEQTITYSFVGMNPETRDVVVSSRTQIIDVKLANKMIGTIFRASKYSSLPNNIFANKSI